ncbi:MAG TPA: class I SAM-dependent methyltransferase [Actinomycetota bacterium]|nr:class I SAM-dependent methyltransferase [Actinomycetota bacterium]
MIKLLKRVARSTFRRLGFDLVSTGAARESTYIEADATIAAARSAGVSVTAYVEDLWDQQGATKRVIDWMAQVGCLGGVTNVLEIGPGTGRYLERVLEKTHCSRYEIYETAQDWSKWLSGRYGPTVAVRSADGHSLSATADKTCELVHAHGVFVYLNVLNTYEYLFEMDRVCAPGGVLVFDFYPAEAFDEKTARAWLAHPERYATVIAEANIRDLFIRRGYTVLGEMDNPHGRGVSRYLALRKPGPV